MSNQMMELVVDLKTSKSNLLYNFKQIEVQAEFQNSEIQKYSSIVRGKDREISNLRQEQDFIAQENQTLL